MKSAIPAAGLLFLGPAVVLLIILIILNPYNEPMSSVWVCEATQWCAHFTLLGMLLLVLFSMFVILYYGLVE